MSDAVAHATATFADLQPHMDKGAGHEKGQGKGHHKGNHEQWEHKGHGEQR
jgi:hypothetical protein